MIVAPSSTATCQSCEVPMERRASPCSSASFFRRAKWGREASGSWLKGGIVIRPTTRTGERSMKVPRSAGATPPLPSSPAMLTSTRISVSAAACVPSWVRTESVATEWIRRQAGSSCLTLRLCRLPMKSHSKASPQRSCLASSSCWRFSPTRRTPASASAPISSSGTYLVAARISTSGPAICRARARLAAIFSASRPWIRPGTSALPPIEPDEPGLPSRVAVAAMREEERALPAGAEVSRLDLLDAGLAQLPARLAPEVDLVATGTDAGADCGGGRSHGARPAERYPLLEAAPATVHDRSPAGAYGGDREAVGAEDEADRPGVGDHVA